MPWNLIFLALIVAAVAVVVIVIAVNNTKPEVKNTTKSGGDVLTTYDYSNSSTKLTNSTELKSSKNPYFVKATDVTSNINGNVNLTTRYAFGAVNLSNPGYIAYGEAASGSAGASLMYSYDGINYNSVIGSKGLIDTVTNVMWNGVMWVGIGSLGGANKTVYSYNGTEWENGSTSPFGSSAAITGLAWDPVNKWWWISGDDADNCLRYSSDGINTWNIADGLGLVSGGFTKGITVIGDDLWVYGLDLNVSGKCVVYTNLRDYPQNTTFTTFTTFDTPQINAFVYTGNYYIAGAENGNLYYFTRNSMSLSNYSLNIGPVYNVAINGLNMIAVAETNTYRFTLTSSEISDGFQINPVSNTNINWNGKYWILSGVSSEENVVLISTDGINFGDTNISSSVDYFTTCYGVAYNFEEPNKVTTTSPMMVTCFAPNGPIASPPIGPIFWSVDGTTWNPPVTFPTTLYYAYYVCFNDQANDTNKWPKFMALAGDANQNMVIVTSNDGMNWIEYMDSGLGIYDERNTSLITVGNLWFASKRGKTTYGYVNNSSIAAQNTTLKAASVNFATNGKVVVASGSIENPVNPTINNLLGIAYCFVDNPTKWFYSTLTGVSFESIAYSKEKDMFVTGGYGGIYYSYDGNTWNSCTVKDSSGNIITYSLNNSGNFIYLVNAVDPIGFFITNITGGPNYYGYSTDGINYTLSPTPFDDGGVETELTISGFSYDGKNVVVMGNNQNDSPAVGYISPENINTLVPVSSILDQYLDDGTFYNIVSNYNSTTTVEVLQSLVGCGSGTSPLTFSRSGFNWIQASGHQPFEVANQSECNGELYVAVGKPLTTSNVGGSIAYSNSGVTWKTVPGSESLLSEGKAVAWSDFMEAKGNPGWVAIGTGGIAHSYNGTSWYSSSSFFNGNGVVYSHNKWIAVSKNGIITSNNGIDWSTTSQRGNYNAIFASGIYTVAVGVNIISYTQNGNNWANLLIDNKTFNSISYNGNTWVVVGNNGVIVSSSNLTNWTFLNQSSGSAVTSSVNLKTVTWNRSHWNAGTDKGLILYSNTDDLTLWTSIINDYNPYGTAQFSVNHIYTNNSYNTQSMIDPSIYIRKTEQFNVKAPAYTEGTINTGISISFDLRNPIV